MNPRRLHKIGSSYAVTIDQNIIKKLKLDEDITFFDQHEKDGVIVLKPRRLAA
jgi:hypothetical protein